MSSSTTAARPDYTHKRTPPQYWDQLGPPQPPNMKDAVPLIVGITTLFLVLSTVFLTTRCYVRIKKNSFAIDDWLLVIGWVRLDHYKQFIRCHTHIIEQAVYMVLIVLTIGGAIRGVGLKDVNSTFGPNWSRAGEVIDQDHLASK